MTTAKSFSLGIVARCDNTGLGNQTRNMVRMLNPDKVLVIDSTPFNKNEQNFHWYDEYNTDKVYGFPTIQQYQNWMQGLTHILTCESFYNDLVINKAMRLGIKTFVQPNFEFMDAMIRPMTAPTKYLMPSRWKVEEVKSRYPSTMYLPPPIFPEDFAEAREVNRLREGKRRFVHIVGKEASKDRNGTRSLLSALKYTESDFELVIKSQFPLESWSEDQRVTVEIGNHIDPQDLYKGFDAMILPRRYGGLCMPMIEALVSGLPVIMTDISPNNSVLPREWLAPAVVHDKLLTRMWLDVFAADETALAKTIDKLCEEDLGEDKLRAIRIGETYSADNLRERYIEAMNGL